MDYQKFLEQLPALYENWGLDSVRPKSNRFAPVLEQVQGTIAANTMQLLNWAVECMEPDEAYCEIGCFQGASLIAALLDSPERMAYAVDNFAQEEQAQEQAQENIEKLQANLREFDMEERVLFCYQEFEEFFAELRETGLEEKIGVYFYAAAADYRSQLLGLLLGRNFLADRALIVVNHRNWSHAEQAVWDFISTHQPYCQRWPDDYSQINAQINGDFKWGKGIDILIWDSQRESGYDWQTLKSNRQELAIAAIEKSSQEFEKQKQETADELYKEARSWQYTGHLAEAEAKYIEMLQWDNTRAEVWQGLAEIYSQTDRYAEAFAALAKALAMRPGSGSIHYSMGLLLEKIGDRSQAILAYRQAIALDNQLTDGYNKLGNLLLAAGEIDEAEAIYSQGILARPEHFGCYLNLGKAMVLRERLDRAIELYQQALGLDPCNPEILQELGLAWEIQQNWNKSYFYYGYSYYYQNKYREAIAQYEQYLEKQGGDVTLYKALADCHRRLEERETAIKYYREGIARHPQSADLYLCLVVELQNCGQTEEAIATAKEASQVLPDEFVFKIEENLMLPVLYETEEEIEYYRQRFSRGLDELITETELDKQSARGNALKGIGYDTNFYLAYQAKNDLELQKKYGDLVHRIMAANYPEWVVPRSMPPLTPAGKIRIGYISNNMRGHSVGKSSIGWLRYCNRQQFEVYCYYTSQSMDEVVRQFQLYSDVFHHIPNNLEAVCDRIIKDNLHILVFLDIGMDAPMTQIGGLRLAPVQCVRWGHPITTGLPTIDYYLSNELMEPENGQDHYSEQLIRLPKIGKSYPERKIPELFKTRADFRLRDEAVVYLSCQSLYKYLPQYDWVFAEIALRVPTAQFAFISSHQSKPITAKFQQRLKRAFNKVGLNGEDYCVILPRQSQIDFWNLGVVSDVFLDLFSWSGDNTALEAIACHLPIVTCPGQFMRERHAYGILKMLGVKDTVAKNPADYIEIAVRLGLDPVWRSGVVEAIGDRHSYIYEDKTCVVGLEDFYQSAVAEGQTPQWPRQ